MKKVRENALFSCGRMSGRELYGYMKENGFVNRRKPVRGTVI